MNQKPIDIINMPLDAILGWLQAPQTSNNRDTLWLILNEHKQNILDSLAKETKNHE